MVAFLVVILDSSFILKKKRNNEPRTEPCGTPRLTFSHPEDILLWVFLFIY